MMTNTGFAQYCLNNSLIRESKGRILGPVLYQPTIFSLAIEINESVYEK